MKSKFFQVSFFYDKNNWKQIFEHAIKPFLDRELNVLRYIIYFSDFRGNAINFTFFSANISESKRIINSFLGHIYQYTSQFPSTIKRNNQQLNGSIFKDFSYDRFYFGLHQELIKNYRKDYEIRFPTFQNLLSRIMIDEFSKVSLTDDALISFLLVIYISLDKTMEIASNILQKSYDQLEKTISADKDVLSPREYSTLQNSVINYINQLDHTFANQYGELWWLEELKELSKGIIKANVKPEKLHFELIAVINTQLGLYNGKGAFLASCMQRYYAVDNLQLL